MIECDSDALFLRLLIAFMSFLTINQASEWNNFLLPLVKLTHCSRFNQNADLNNINERFT